MRDALNKTEVSNETKRENKIKDDIKLTFKLLVSKRMMLVVPFILWSSMSQVIYLALFIPLMTRTMTNSPKYPEL